MKRNTKNIKAGNGLQNNHAVVAMFSISKLKEGLYGEKAYRHLLGNLDFRQIGNCTIVSGDAIPDFETYMIGFLDLDGATAKYIYEKVASAFFIYDIGKSISTESKALGMQEFGVKDNAEWDSLYELGSVLSPSGAVGYGEGCKNLPLMANGKISNGVLTPGYDSLLKLVLRQDLSLRKRIEAEAREGFLVRRASAESKGTRFNTAINETSQNKKEGE